MNGQKEKLDRLGILTLELWGFLFGALAFIALFSLMSYLPEDMALRTYQEQTTRNWIGPGGALLSHGLFTFLGLQAYLMPLFLFAFAFLCLFKKVWRVPVTRFMGYLMMMLGVSVLLDILWPTHARMPFLPGGHLGYVIHELLQPNLHSLGSFLVAFGLCLCAAVLITRASLVEGAGMGLSFLLGKMTFFKKISFKLPKISLFKKSDAQASASDFSTALIKRDDTVPEPEKQKSLLPAVLKNPFTLRERSEPLSKKIVEKADKTSPLRARDYKLPALKLLDYDAPPAIKINENTIKKQAELLQKTFGEFGILGQIREVRPGPVVTVFEFVPAPGIKVSRIAALADDIAMAMEAVHVRIVAPIPGKGAVGIEVPNEHRETVYLKEIVADPAYRKEPHPLCMAVGKSVSGRPYFVGLHEMPHLLIAGTTGSGKSVAVNAMICSILYRATPDDVRFLMIDPKMLELSIYEGIPHLLLPPIIDSKKATQALKWAVKEMDRRYLLMNELGVRDLNGFNEKIDAAKGRGQPLKREQDDAPYERIPYLVVVVDEYADLVMVSGKDVESYVMRLAQKARACGIHVILATQRPSVDVITGVIKANFPVLIFFRVAAAHDSKTIINRGGAEKLLGRGDMLIMPPGTSELYRVHGAFVSEKELFRVVEHWKGQSTPDYDMSIVDNTEEEGGSGEGASSDVDDKYEDAVAIVRRTQRASTSWIQRQLGVGYNRAARIVEQMEQHGVVGPIQNAKGDREIF